MSNEVANFQQNVPDYLRDKEKTARIGNIDSSDLIIPRIKLLHAVSPEITDYQGTAKSGEFWHTVRFQSLGKELIGTPIIARKSQVLWAPRGDDRGILARSRDGVKWEPPHGEFQVKFQNNPNVYTWRLAPTVAESGLAEWGSSRPGDKASPPAAALTYEVLWWFPTRPDIRPAIILNSRGSVKPCQNLFSALDDSTKEHFYLVFSIKSVVAKGPNNVNYFNYSYTALGYLDQKDAVISEGLFKRFENVAFRASDERDEDAPPTGGKGNGAPMERTSDDKF